METLTTQPMGHGQTHAKVILFGEHSVVYGKPAIAFPVRSLKLDAYAYQTQGDWSIRTPYFEGLVAPSDARGEDISGLERTLSEIALMNTLRILGKNPPGIRVEVSGLVPPARGLGSSAAAAGAIARAVTALYGVKLTGEEMFHLVQSVETVAHGTPSGLDAYATTASGPIWFTRGKAESLEIMRSPRLLIADTGEPGHTAEAVRGVRERYEKQEHETVELLDEMAWIAQQAKIDLATGNIGPLGTAMLRNHEILNQLGVGTGGLDHLTRAATNAGALGAKLTGGGLGGCIVALVEDRQAEQRVKTALINAGARDVWRVHGEENE